MNPKTQYFLRSFLIVCGYFAVAYFSLKLATINNNASPVWPATGLAIGILYRWGHVYALSIFLGAFFVNLTTGSPLIAIAAIALGNTLEALLGAWILQRILRVAQPPDLATDLKAFTTSSLVASLVSASVGTTALLLTRTIPPETYWTAWFTWYTGDAVGALMLMPWMLWLLNPSQPPFSFRKVLSEAFLFRLTIASGMIGWTSYFVFYNSLGASYVFIIFPSLLSAHWLLGVWGGRLATVVLCGISIFAATQKLGPFAFDNFNQNLIALQILLASLVFTSLALEIFARVARFRLIVPVLLASWTAFGSIFYFAHRSLESENQIRFETAVIESENRIQDRLETYINLLQGGIALFDASETVERHEWRAYIESLRIDERVPGVEGFGYAQIVEPSQLLAFEAKERKDRAPDFKISSVPHFGFEQRVHNPQNHFIVKFIEPSHRNQHRLGRDLGSERIRREAAELAWQSGKPTLTRQIFLRANDQPRSGALLFIPHFQDRVHRGWAFAPIIFEDFLRATFGSHSNRHLDMILIEERPDSPLTEIANLSNQSLSQALQLPRSSLLLRPIEMAQQRFLIAWIRNAAEGTSLTLLLSWIAAAGALLALAFAWIIVSNIAYRDRAEEQVRLRTLELTNRQRTWQHLTDTLPVGIFQTDLEGRFIFINPRWASLTGLGLKDLEGGNWFRSVHHKDREIVESQWREALQKRNTIDTEIRVVDSKGQIRWVGWVFIPIMDEQGQCTGFLGALMDQTERKNQARAIEKERARVAQSAKMASLGEMAGGIAHEINNPLTVILAKASTLKNMRAETLDLEVVNKAGEKIVQTTDRIVKIIRGLRAFSRNAEQDPPTVISLQSIIDDTLSLCSEKMKSHEIHFTVSGHLNEPVSCRPAQISQVILNLINNSIDAIKLAHERWIKIEGHIEDKMLQVWITDSGPGIPGNIQSRLMEPFFTTKEVGVGTGLGLSICRGLIESHGGKFWYDPTSPHTRFVFELPIDIASKSQSAS